MRIHSQSYDCGHSCCLRVENMSVQVGGSRILKDVNLHVHCGQLVAIIGPNGVRGKIPVPMTNEEVDKMQHSERVLKEVISQLDL